MNKLNFKTRLASNQVNQDTLARLSGVKTVLQGMKTYAEANSIHLGSLSAAAMLGNHAKSFKDKLTATLTQAMGAGTPKTLEEKTIYAEYQEMIRRDIAMIGAKLDKQITMYGESYLANAYSPFQLATLPHIYLETIAMNVRFLMPVKEYESEQIPPKRFAIKQLVIAGKKYDFPHCLKNAEVMRELTKAGSTPIEVEILKSELKKVNLFDKSNGAGTKGTDTLIPQLDIVEITHNTSEVLKVKVSSTAPDAHNYTRGRIFKEVADKNILLSGEIDFATGELKMLCSDTVEKVKVRVYKSGVYNRNVASVDIKTETIVQMIKNRINMIFDYDSGAIKNFLSLENLDGVLEGQSIIFDSVNAVKDQLGFDTLNGTLQELKDTAKTLGAGMDQTNDGYFTRTHHTKPGLESGFRPQSEEQWDREGLAKRIKEVHSGIAHKFNSTQGVQFNWYASPANVARFVSSTPIITKDENYGGVTTDYAIFGLSVAGALAKVVETERAVDADGFRCVPYSLMVSQPTFEFQQGQHALYTDGTYRSATNPHMPAIAYYDYFDCNRILAIMGDIDVVEGAPAPAGSSL